MIQCVHDQPSRSRKGMAKRKLEEPSASELDSTAYRSDVKPLTAHSVGGSGVEGNRLTARTGDTRYEANHPPVSTTDVAVVPNLAGDVVGDATRVQADMANQKPRGDVALGPTTFHPYDPEGVDTPLDTRTGDTGLLDGPDEREQVLNRFWLLLQDAGYELW